MCGIIDLNIQNKTKQNHWGWGSSSLAPSDPNSSGHGCSHGKHTADKGHSREPARTRETSEGIREEADEALLKLFKSLALLSSCVCVNLTLKSPGRDWETYHGWDHRPWSDWPLGGVHTGSEERGKGFENRTNTENTINSKLARPCRLKSAKLIAC